MADAEHRGHGVHRQHVHESIAGLRDQTADIKLMLIRAEQSRTVQKQSNFHDNSVIVLLEISQGISDSVGDDVRHWTNLVIFGVYMRRYHPMDLSAFKSQFDLHSTIIALLL